MDQCRRTRRGVTARAVTAHDVVLRRVGERTAALDKAISEAVDAGVLKRFNSEYRKRRLQAKQGGQRFMSYSEAQARLRKVIADAVASGGRIPRSFVAAVFEESGAAGFVSKAISPSRGRPCVG